MPAPSSLAMHYAWVLVLCGVVGVALGINRTVKRRENESRILQLLSAIGGLVVLALPTVMVLHIKPTGVYTAATLLLMIVFSLCLLARPLKKIPIAFTAVTASGVFLLWGAMRLRGTAFEERIPMEFVVGAIVVILAALFLLCFALEAAVDTVLTILGWGLVITLVSAIAVIHGALIANGVTGPEGLQHYLR
jgi:lysylphosphatidylglycerol synthetase-like protein (DUF2156 family)